MTQKLFGSNDPTSTSPQTFGTPNVRQIYQQMKQQRQIKQQAAHHFGKSAVQSQAQDIFKTRVEAAMGDSDKCEEFHGRDYVRMQDSFQDALRVVHENYGRPDEYSWFIHPETLSFIEDLYDFFRRLESVPKESVTRSSLEFHGVPFESSPSVPEGWVLLAHRERLEEGSLHKPIYPHPMALIREIDAGFQERVEMTIGGEMYFRVINA